MWLVFALGSAFFAGITAILAKIGIKNTDSNVATAVRTVVVLIFSWLMVFLVGSQNTISQITPKTLVFLVLSGVATGGSWLCYFKAIQLGDINKVTPVDKSSTLLTMLLSCIILGEPLTLLKVVSMVLIALGTYIMIMKCQVCDNSKKSYRWLIFAILSAIFASFTSILGKIGIEGIESNLGTAIRTIVVLIMAWIVVFVTKKQHTIKCIDKKSWLFICLSGVATGASWLCYYRALQTGQASIVVPLDKLSIVITVIFAQVFLKEKLTKRVAIGLISIVFGTLLLLC